MPHGDAPRSDERTLAQVLRTAGIPHDLVDVGDYARTADEAARNLRSPLSAIVKSLVCVADGSPVLALVPGDRALSFEKLRRLVGAQAVKLAARRVVEGASGYAVGAVAPIGLPPGLRVYGEITIRHLDSIYCGAGSDRHMVRISPRDLDLVTPITWADLCE